MFLPKIKDAKPIKQTGGNAQAEAVRGAVQIYNACTDTEHTICGRY